MWSKNHQNSRCPRISTSLQPPLQSLLTLVNRFGFGVHIGFINHTNFPQMGCPDLWRQWPQLILHLRPRRPDLNRTKKPWRNNIIQPVMPGDQRRDKENACYECGTSKNLYPQTIKWQIGGRKWHIQTMEARRCPKEVLAWRAYKSQRG